MSSALVASPPAAAPRTPAKTFTITPSKLRLGDDEVQLPSGCKIKVDWNLKSPKLELSAEGGKLAWQLSEVSQIEFNTSPGQEVCMRLHLDTDTPEGKGKGGGEDSPGALGDAVRRGALRRGWKVVYLQRQDAEKARSSLKAWHAKVPQLEVTEAPPCDDTRRALVLASPPAPAGPTLEALVATCLAATLRIGIAVPDTPKAREVLGKKRDIEPRRRPGGLVVGIGSGFLVDDGEAPALVFSCEHVRWLSAAVVRQCGGGRLVALVPDADAVADEGVWHFVRTLAHTRHWDRDDPSTRNDAPDPAGPAAKALDAYTDAAVLELQAPLPEDGEALAAALVALGGEAGGAAAGGACTALVPSSPPSTQLARRARVPRGLRLGDSSALKAGVHQLRVFGYPQAAGGTATPTVGNFGGEWCDPDTGRWLKLQGLVMPGHSGGPCVDEAGRVVGWNVRNQLRHVQAGLNELRPVEEGLACLRAAREQLRHELSAEQLNVLMGGTNLGIG